VIVLGSGRIFNALNLSLVNSLPNDIADADWLNTMLYTIRASGMDTQVQAWSSNYAQAGAVQLAGNPLRFLAIGSKLEAVTQVSGRPKFNELDGNLSILFQGPTPTPTPTPTPITGPTPKVAVSVSPSRINEGQSAIFQISASANTRRPVTINYSIAGTAAFGSDYGLSNNLGPVGQIVIPIGADSASITLTATADGVLEKKEAATMNLSAGTGYKLSPHKKAKLTIDNSP